MSLCLYWPCVPINIHCPDPPLPDGIAVVAQVEKARDRIEQQRYEDWLRHKPDSDLEFDWDLDEPFNPYQPPGGM